MSTPVFARIEGWLHSILRITTAVVHEENHHNWRGYSALRTRELIVRHCINAHEYAIRAALSVHTMGASDVAIFMLETFKADHPDHPALDTLIERARAFKTKHPGVRP